MSMKKKHQQQVIIIHGGDSYETQEEFLRSLANEQVTKDSFDRDYGKYWKDNLASMLGRKFEVFFPTMPNKQNARYEEWKAWFEKLLGLIDEQPIFVGHSLGGIFLAQYFAENQDTKKTKALFLVAAPFDRCGDFDLPADLSRLAEMGDRVRLYFSTDDEIVSFDSYTKYRKALPEAQSRIFKNKNHFFMKKFPEIVKEIKSLL
jgi:predicted alpha/beta hydrolase family esterase